jgi:hypothetical protein
VLTGSLWKSSLRELMPVAKGPRSQLFLAPTADLQYKLEHSKGSLMQNQS